MNEARKALYLLADSQLLFLKADSNRLLDSMRNDLCVHESSVTRAAYLGMSNDDNPDIYNLFLAAMNNINTHESRMISASGTEDELEFLKAADLILLAGGDVAKGWKIIQEKGIGDILFERYLSGAVLAGVSAGAVQLGMGFWDDGKDRTFIDTSKIFPYYVDVHDEARDWSRLKTLVQSREDHSKGYGIATGAALIYHADSTIEPIRCTLDEFSRTPSSPSELQRNILLPDDASFRASNS